jgi:predicted permease
MLKDRQTRQLSGLARLKPGVTMEQARQEIAALAVEIAKGSPRTNQGMSATVLPLWKSHFSAQSVLLLPLQILAAVCLVVLLIACANVANLLLARFVARRKDFSLRLALGSGRLRLARQILAESLLLAAAGSIAGVVMATWMSGSLGYLLPSHGNDPIALEGLHLNGQALAFTVLVCVATALLAGAAPALHCMKVDLNDSLKESGRSATGGQTSHRLRSLLVVSEVSLALVALIGAGLFVRAFEATRRIDPGFEPSNVLLSSFYLSTSGYNLDQREEFCRRLREKLESEPGVTAVSYADGAPLGFQGSWWEPTEVQGYVPTPGENMKIYRNVVAPGYLGLMRIPLLQGRDFTEHDDNDHHPDVMIVTQAFQKRFLGTGDPIGRKVRGWGRWFTVIGVAKDSKYFSLTEDPIPYYYVPFRQVYREDMNLEFYVRTAGDPNQAIPLLRRDVKEIDPNVIIFESVPMVDYIGASWFAQKMAASLLSALGAIALLLAALGLYSVMAYSVSQRTHEIGVRMALGAQQADVLVMVLRSGMVLTAAGLVVGIGVALVLVSRILGVTANTSVFGGAGTLLGANVGDPLIYLAAAGFLSVIAALASYIPARRATKVDPMVALRYE